MQLHSEYTNLMLQNRKDLVNKKLILDSIHKRWLKKFETSRTSVNLKDKLMDVNSQSTLVGNAKINQSMNKLDIPEQALAISENEETVGKKPGACG